MLRFLFVFMLLVAVAALFARAPRARRVLWTILALIALYGVLKATGAIEAIAPARDGVF